MQRQTYIDTMKQKIIQKRLQIQRALDSLEEKSGEAKETARKRYHRAKDQLNELDKKLDRLKDASEDTWENIKDDLDKLWDTIKNEFDDEDTNK